MSHYSDKPFEFGGDPDHELDQEFLTEFPPLRDRANSISK